MTAPNETVDNGLIVVRLGVLRHRGAADLREIRGPGRGAGGGGYRDARTTQGDSGDDASGDGCPLDLGIHGDAPSRCCGPPSGGCGWAFPASVE